MKPNGSIRANNEQLAEVKIIQQPLLTAKLKASLPQVVNSLLSRPSRGVLKAAWATITMCTGTHRGMPPPHPFNRYLDGIVVVKR
jgi:hypothetical protein